jgi:hypothetical protein
MPLLTTPARYVGDSRAADHDGVSFSDDGESAADQFLAITPDGRITRPNDYFTASLGGRAAIRNSMVRGDLHSRHPSATKKPKTYLADGRLRTIVGMKRAYNGDSSSATTNHFCRRGWPFGRARHKRVITSVCMAYFGVVRSGDRAAVKSEGPSVIMNGGFATHRGSLLFCLHRGAYLPKERVAGNLMYDPVLLLGSLGVDVNGAEAGRPVCEGYAAFMFGYYCELQKRRIMVHHAKACRGQKDVCLRRLIAKA